MGRTELHPVELKPFPEYRKLSSLGGSSPISGQSLRWPLQLPPPGPRIQLRRGQPQPAPRWGPAGLPIGRSLLDPQALGAPPPSP
ncbi:protein PRRC2A-like [Gopherus evgoodei]|uniref:protein PRRC2A-like n=1 Tax=Gopherus evgoodei TaxID=1825980 RepID=UPI0011CFE965|nr:protein PRRC2A-like [Gopherus evgoodei]